MTDALREIHDLQQRATSTSAPNFRRLNLAWAEALDLRNLVQVAELVTRSALARRESRGAHYRSDFPLSDDARWLRNVHLQRSSDGGLQLWDEGVVFRYLAPPGVQAAAAV
jgi:succinate dehydrogenase/fumarate reductase flavoprotein subunit